MFNCKQCEEKEKLIDYLKSQVKDLTDRLMAFNSDAFYRYKQETKELPPLYPEGVDDKGVRFSYKEMDTEKAKDEIFRAMGEEPINVEDEK